MCVYVCVCVVNRELRDGEYVPCAKHASAAVYDIPSQSNTLLGSVCYSDTFVDSAITLTHPGPPLAVSLFAVHQMGICVILLIKSVTAVSQCVFSSI